MNKYQTLYEIAKQELKQLEITLKELERKLEQEKQDYKTIDNNLYEQDKLLYELIQKEENMPYKNTSKKLYYSHNNILSFRIRIFFCNNKYTIYYCKKNSTNNNDSI